MARFAVFVCVAMALIVLAAARIDRRKISRWFDAENELGSVREKRAYGSNFYQGSGSGWKKGSNMFERVGHGQKRLRCFALTKTATNEWCSENCVRGYCPMETCKCKGLETDYSYGGVQQQKGYGVSQGFGGANQQYGGQGQGIAQQEYGQQEQYNQQ